MRRDFNAYFTSPIGYIFMMVFVTMSVGLYMTSFFGFPVADMRPYFSNLPLFLCVFIPAVTMRVWAEERKENTWEMLLTFPMQARDLVLGKFFAALIFFALTLFATVTVPVMLYSLGKPDTGVILSGYFGTLLLGGFFLSLGIFFSGFFKDQIVAFVVTLLTCFSLFLVGISFIASYLDDRMAGLGSFLSDALGVFSHYGAFTRGVIDFADIAFFLVWTVVFLVLNIYFIDGRNRPKAKTIFAGAVGLCLVCGLLFNYLMVGQSFGRIDMTEDKIYTVSKASKNILSQVDTPVQIKLYITPKDKMPTGMKDLEQDIVDKLEELRVGSSGKVAYDTVYLEVANVIAERTPQEEDGEKTEEEAIEKRMLDKGVEPFNVQAMSQDEVTSKLVYSSLGVAYKDKPEEIIPQILPQSLPELEYRLVSTVHKLTREKAPIVALVAPKEAINIDPQMRAIYQQLGQPIPQSDDPYVYLQQILEYEKYDVRRVELTKESPLPEEYDTLAIVNPRSLNDRQRWEINRALHSGKSVIMAVQNYEWDYQATRQGTTISRRDEKPEVNTLLKEYGLGVSEDILMDENKVPLRVQSGGNSLAAMLGGGQTLTLPMHILLNTECMNPDTAITNRLSTVFYLWGTGLEMDEDKLDELGLKAKTLMSSSDKSWTVASSDQVKSSDFDLPGASKLKSQPLMAMIEGQFPDTFAGKERPDWPKAPPANPYGQPPAPEPNEPPEPPAAAVSPAEGKLILLGCSQLFRKNFIQSGGDNLNLFLNSVDGLSLNENLVHVRGHSPINRVIDKATEGQKTFWRLANYSFANLLIGGIGIGLLVARRRARNAYTMAAVK